MSEIAWKLHMVSLASRNMPCIWGVIRTCGKKMKLHALLWDFQLNAVLLGFLIKKFSSTTFSLGFAGRGVVKNPPANAEDAGAAGSIPGSGRSPGGGTCNPLQSSCLENPMDRGAWPATVHGVTKSRTWLSMHAGTFSLGFHDTLNCMRNKFDKIQSW